MSETLRLTRPARGFSLVEGIVALGLLGTALLSVASLFVLGERQVRSGRSHSTALGVARNIMEEMSGWAYRDLHRGFGLSGSVPAYTVDTRFTGSASKWQRALDRELPGSHARIGIESIADGLAPVLGSASAVRLTVTIFWHEGPRTRSVQLATVRS